MKMEDHMRTNLKQVPTMKIFDFALFTKSIDDIIELTIGEPDLNTPEHVKQAGIAAIQNNHTHYAPQRGRPGYWRPSVIPWRRRLARCTISGRNLSNQWGNRGSLRCGYGNHQSW